MLARYQKPGGFNQLVRLLEGFGEQKRQKFLKLIENENPLWAEVVPSKMLSVDRICSWPEDIRKIVFNTALPHSIGVTLHGVNEENKNKVLAVLNRPQKVKVLDIYDNGNPGLAEIEAAFVRLLGEVRGFASQGFIDFQTFDSELYIEDDIEARLNRGDIHVKGGAQPAGSNVHTFELHPQSQATSSPTAGVPESEAALQMRSQLIKLIEINRRLTAENQVLKEALLQISRNIPVDLLKKSA